MAGVAVTVAKKYLTSFITERGSNQAMGVFTATVDTGDYASGGFEVDLSPYMKKINVVVPIQEAGSTAQVFALDDAEFSDAKPKLMLFESGAEDAPMKEKGSEACVASTYTLFVIGS